MQIGILLYVTIYFQNEFIIEPKLIQNTIQKFHKKNYRFIVIHREKNEFVFFI